MGYNVSGSAHYTPASTGCTLFKGPWCMQLLPIGSTPFVKFQDSAGEFLHNPAFHNDVESLLIL